MRAGTIPVRKITVSLPSDLVDFADDQAAKNNTSRSGAISLILARAKALEEEQLAAEGYQFYPQESAEFAEADASAVAEAIGGGKFAEHDG